MFWFNIILRKPLSFETERTKVPSAIPGPVTVWPLVTAAVAGVGLIDAVVKPRVSKPPKLVEPTVPVTITGATPNFPEGVFILPIKGFEITL